MKEDSRPNPYNVLGLPPAASTAEIVARAEELFALAGSEADRSLYRWARQELIRDSPARRLHALLQAPGAAYRDHERAAFDQRFGRNPADIETLAADSLPRATDFDLVAIMARLVDSLLTPPEPDVGAALRHPPVSPGWGTPPLGVDDVLFG